MTKVQGQLLMYVQDAMAPKTSRRTWRPEIARLETQRDALDAEIEMMEKMTKVDQLDPKAIAAAVKSTA